MKKYSINVVEGSLIDKKILDKYNPKVVEDFKDEWGKLINITATLEQIKKIQKEMIKHYDNSVPWYLDGHEEKNDGQIICAFGADDGEGGKIFLFDRGDKLTYDKIKSYAISKGIPSEQMNFLEVSYSK